MKWVTIISILQMGKLRHRAQKHTGNKWWNQELNPGRQTSEAVFLVITLQSLSNKSPVFTTDTKYFK